MTRYLPILLFTPKIHQHALTRLIYQLTFSQILISESPHLHLCKSFIVIHDSSDLENNGDHFYIHEIKGNHGVCFVNLPVHLSILLYTETIPNAFDNSVVNR